MLTLKVPNNLTRKINKMADSVCQTPEEYIIELIAERIEHDSAYEETTYLAKSNSNRKRLEEAIRDIRHGKCEPHGLIHDND